MSNNRDGTMPILEHLAELRLRLLISAGALLVSTIICFANVEYIRSIITEPLGGLNLIFLSPPEAFMANLRLSLTSGLVISSPVIIYQLLAFAFPGLTRSEKIFFISTIFGAFLLFGGGVVFAYIVVFPFTLRFFLQFASGQLSPLFTVTEYISFIVSFHFAFGAVFQLPLVTWALGKIGLLSTEFLRRNRKIALLIMLIGSSIITPPDIVSQVILVFPLMFLYEVGIIMVMISERKRLKLLSE